MRRVACALLLAACSGGAAHPDAASGGDSSFEPSPCPYTFGHTFALSSVTFMPPGMGFDIDGDGNIDNAFGFIGPIANQVVAYNITTGGARYLFDIEGWDQAPADDPAATMVAFGGFDADSPPDPSNDFSGSGRFNVSLRDFDVNCRPQNVSHAGPIAHGELQTKSDRWGLFVGNVGDLEFVKVGLQFTIASDLSTGDGTMGAVMTACAMSRAYIPQLSSGTMLGIMLSNNHQPDIDVDGDGKETLDFAVDQITGCHDGDGTYIPGPTCPCDPRMADGYSLAVQAHGVRCEIAGVIDNE